MRSLRWVLLLSIALCTSCVFYSAMDAAKDEPIGSAQFNEPDEPPVDFTAAHCSSGEWELFHGADFIDDSGQDVRLIVDPLGNTTLRFFDRSQPLDTGLLFAREACETFHLTLGRSGWEINEIHDLEVRVEFSCRNAAGATARGKLEAAHCH